MSQPSKPRVWALIAAAGQGSRMQAGINKQWLHLEGEPVLARTVALFEAHDAVDAIAIVAAADDLPRVEKMHADRGWSKPILRIQGGASRQDSVHRGLKAIRHEPRSHGQDIVLVHDGARCLLDAATVDRVLAKVRSHGASGAAIAVKDTIKQADAQGKVIRTLDRETLWAMQTPQGASLQDLCAAYEKIDRDALTVTDDLAALQAAGHAVHLALGSEDNIKLTTPADLDLARIILRRRGQEGGRH